MKPERKYELKGALKAITVIAVLGIMIGVGYATVVITDEGVWVDSNPVIVEGSYSTWTHKWNNTLPEGLSSVQYIGTLLDDFNDVLVVVWKDGSADRCLGTFNLEDFSVVSISSSGGSYLRNVASMYNTDCQLFGLAYIENGGFSRSIQSYVFILRSDSDTLEVWRGGYLLWSHDINIDAPGKTPYYAEISPTGKWILIITQQKDLVLYEGS